MTSRERIIETLNHRKADMLAIDFGGMRSTGISAIAYNKLKDYLGIKSGQTKVYDIFQQLAEPEPGILERFGGDVVQLHRYAPSFGIVNDGWKPGKLPDGSSCIVPKRYNPVSNEKGEQEIWEDSRALCPIYRLKSPEQLRIWVMQRYIWHPMLQAISQELFLLLTVDGHVDLLEIGRYYFIIHTKNITKKG